MPIADMDWKRLQNPKIPPLSHQLVFWLLVVVGVAGDLWSKWAVFNALGPHDQIELIPGFLRFIEALNDGAAFSMARGQRPFLIGVSVVAWIIILCVFYWNGRQSRLVLISLGMFAGGILGNLYDRSLDEGLVRDFIDVYVGTHHWPTFNVADSLLCIAVGLLMLSSLTQGKSNPVHDPLQTEACPSPPPKQ